MMTEPVTPRPAEPALIIGFVTTVLAALVPLGLPGLSANQVTLIDAFVVAVGGLLIAIRTRPVAPGVFTALISAGAALFAGYGIEVPSVWVGAVAAIVTATLAFITRVHVWPVAEPGRTL